MSDIKPSYSTFQKFIEIANLLIENEKVTTIFEFGARYGEDTVEFAKKYPHATVYTFECNPNSLPECKERVSKYSNIILTEKAVTDENGIISFYAIDKENTITTWEDGNQGASSLLKASGKYEVEQYAQKEVFVEGITLNTFIQENNIPNIDLLWMDIQGAELKALQGLKDKISFVKLIHIEVEFMEIYTNQPLFQDIKIFFDLNGFIFLGFTSKGLYSADAVFVNSNFYKKNYKKKIETILNKKEILEKKKMRLAAKKLLKKTWHLIGKIVVFPLPFIKKNRSFDDTFPIYFPRFTKRELYLWYLKIVKPLFKLDVQYRKNIYSTIPIDILIPTIDKDLDLLEQVIVAAKENIKHPIKHIFIISKNNDTIKKIVSKHSCVFIDENTLLPISKESISYTVNGKDRSGWLFQQLLKLSGDKISTQEHFLVLDSDTIFIRPKIFIHRGKMIFDHSEEYHFPYHHVYSQIMQMETQSFLSFISHYMILSKRYLEEMKQYIETKNGQVWINTILTNTNYNEVSGFSEYETYGNYMLTFHRKKMKREFWYNLSCYDNSTLVPNYYKSFSIHSYNKKDRRIEKRMLTDKCMLKD